MRRVWDSNPRGRVNALAVFKTGAYTRLTGHNSATPAGFGTYSARAGPARIYWVPSQRLI